jgi:hypothetical protein
MSWQVDARKNMEAKMLAAANGRFGTPVLFCSFEGIHATGEPISTCLLLPTKEEIPATHWPILDPNEPVPNDVEIRTLCFVVSSTIGTSLVQANSSYELALALGHGVLGMFTITPASRVD